ncbi:hypothetical protein PVAP13_1KG173700 [Panicum virgatum]|uniref:Uncharacterized protein n=1 Tax=Panicum virgatum TaxID=38727 RepID=A0A8T0XE54_PANVG|nr:hypothetical protein PVAP13_1KG173700 [Panicum virgatum]
MEAAAGSAPNRRVRFQRDGDVGVPQFGEALQRRRLPSDRLPLIPFTCDRCDHDASAFWEQQALSARGYTARTIVPACNAVVDMSTNSRDLIERELAAFGQSLDNLKNAMPTLLHCRSVHALMLPEIFVTCGFFLTNNFSCYMFFSRNASYPVILPSKLMSSKGAASFSDKPRAVATQLHKCMLV